MELMAVSLASVTGVVVTVLLRCGRWCWARSSVGVEPDLDAVRVVQADQDRSTLVPGDHTAVGLAQVVQPAPPGLDAVPLGHLEGDRVEAGEGSRPSGVESQS